MVRDVSNEFESDLIKARPWKNEHRLTISWPLVSKTDKSSRLSHIPSLERLGDLIAV